MTSWVSWQRAQPVLVGPAGMTARGHTEGGNELWICGMQAQLAPELPG